MSRTTTTRIEGLKPLLKRLKQLPDRAHRRVLRAAVTKAATPIVKAARKLAPQGTGLSASGEARPHLGRTITKTRAKLSPRTGNIVVVLGPEKDQAPHDHLVHEGTKPHSIALTKPLQLGRITLPAGFVIRHPGAKSQPFLTEALDATRSKSQAILRRSIAQGIEKQAALLARR
jgi:HK97 gp10 family phage protein